MSDIPFKPEKPPKTHEAKPLSSAETNRLAPSVRGTDAPTKAYGAQTKDTEGIPSNAEDRAPNEKADLSEKIAHEKAGRDFRKLCAEHPEKAATFDALDKRFLGADVIKMQVLEAGTEIADYSVVDKPIITYRYHDGINEHGNWVSPEYIPDIKERQERLSLPSKGVLVDRYELQPGCRILRSFAAPAFGHEGGGEQFFVLDEDKMKRV